MEKNLKIKLDKKFSLYGRLNGSLNKPLFIMVHGLPGDIYGSFYEKATSWFIQHGFASFRFNLYGWQKDARQLIDCTLKTHAADLDMVVRYFRKRGVKKICVAGHSFGGSTILLSPEQNFDAVALWDPSFDISFTKTKYGYPGGRYIKALNGYFMRWGTNVIIGKEMAKEADRLVWKHLTKNFYVPLKIIAADKGVLLPGARQYFKTAHPPKSLTVIKGATHHFDDRDDMQENVFKLSKNWFDKF
ncbi:alpha/beta hydrolase [Candidatus Uhrbacteria bacterium]|nr:alpha/beta hydrolase [Candidatus Uhrbacteria bacterium]